MAFSDYFSVANGEDIEHLQTILRDILGIYEKIGLDFVPQDRIILGGMPCPRFCLKEENNIPCDQIHLTMTKFSYWCQVVYQLSHELTHCFIHCHNKEKRYSASWIEETICEAISLYFLAYFRDNWADTPFYPCDPNYSNCFANYLNKIEVKEGNNRLSNCRAYQELMDIDRTSQDQREDRKNEMLGLYRVIFERDMKGLIYYRDFIVPDRKILKCAEYRTAYPYNVSVKYLCDLQDKILRDDKTAEIA